MAAVYPDDIQPGDGGDTPWSAALLEAALVSGSLSAPGDVTPCVNGKWQKDMLLKLRFDRPLETWMIQEIKNSSGSMQPMVVLSGGRDDQSLFPGIHRMLHSHCNASGTTALCYVAKTRANSGLRSSRSMHPPSRGQQTSRSGHEGRNRQGRRRQTQS